MIIEVKVPGVGESVQEGMIESWSKSNGDFVEMDEVLCELETDKATVEVVAEAAGTLEIKIEAGSVVKVGDVIATLDSEGQNNTKAASAETANQTTSTSSGEALDPGPAVRKIAAEKNIDTTQIAGTGRNGRVTKSDLLTQNQNTGNSSAKIAQAPQSNASSPQNSSINVPSGKEREETRKPMAMIRRRIAERLVESQQNAALLTTFNEVDMSAIMDMRKLYKDHFQKKYDIKLGFMGFFLRASTEALKEFPLVNAYIEGTDICYHNYCDIGVAVSTPKGLMVPVIRDVDKMEIVDIERAIGAFADKARNGKISIDDLSGGTFTVSNGGVFGSLLSTPIINPPQTAILGMHKTQMRPMVMEDGSIKARPMMYLALSYDHRLIDGKEAVGFLVKIKECLEDPNRILLGV